MSITDYSYDLPSELIAQQPIPNRAASRMLVVDRTRSNFSDRKFTDFPAMLEKGDVLVLNNTRVFPARIFGVTDTGARVEVFFLEETRDSLWTALARPAKRLKAGRTIRFSDNLSARVVDSLDGGRIALELKAQGELTDILQSIGRTPLPPYVKRDPSDEDRQRYQTVFASAVGAIAAPTAGLHFTTAILDQIRKRGVEVVEITLHVGYGTFEPVRTDDLTQHRVSPERYSIGESSAAALNQGKTNNGRIVAVGTTTTRALETNIGRFGRFQAETGIADLTVTPGYTFRAVDALLTNFHLPESSLLILVSTFGGRELIMEAYRHAVASRYRFYSYGDCMFVV